MGVCGFWVWGLGLSGLGVLGFRDFEFRVFRVWRFRPFRGLGLRVVGLPRREYIVARTSKRLLCTWTLSMSHKSSSGLKVHIIYEGCG